MEITQRRYNFRPVNDGYRILRPNTPTVAVTAEWEGVGLDLTVGEQPRQPHLSVIVDPEGLVPVEEEAVRFRHLPRTLTGAVPQPQVVPLQVEGVHLAGLVVQDQELTFGAHLDAANVAEDEAPVLPVQRADLEVARQLRGAVLWKVAVGHHVPAAGGSGPMDLAARPGLGSGTGQGGAAEEECPRDGPRHRESATNDGVG